MRSILAVAALLLLAACGSDDGATATDPGGEAVPTAIPAAPGTVSTRSIVTVLDAGTPALCLGPVAESWPPQCDGPPIEGWDWADHDGMYERQGSTRWGQFVVTGGWDGSTFTYAGAIPAALYDPAVEPEPTYPSPAVRHTLADIADEVGRDLPGAQGAWVHGGRVLAYVVYDDGSLQAWVDETYGEDVVVLTPQLVDQTE